MKLKRAVKISLISFALVLAVAMSALMCYAYFSTRVYVYTNEGNKEVAQLGMELSLLFDKLDPERVSADQTTIIKLQTTSVSTDSAASVEEVKFHPTDTNWGTKENPYIISDIKHLQNLSALQNIGYFKKLFIDPNFNADGTYKGAENDNMPYFLVCNQDGTPSTIDGTDIVFQPIGNDEYPFIGYVGGAFAQGTTTVTVKDKGDLQSDTSVIFNITARASTSCPDHGLFGSVQHLGSSEDTDGVLQGYVSNISDLLLADIKVVVDSSAWTQIAEFISDHFFSYNLLDSSDGVPHETHHIGILAGHISYASVQNISIYYSNDDIVAVDLNDTTVANSQLDGEGINANYYSSTGIIGFMHGMNPTVADGEIAAGSGANSSLNSFSTMGGGGKKYGTNPGYVLAQQMYNQYIAYSGQLITTTGGIPLYRYKENEVASEIGFMVTPTVVDDKIYYLDEQGHTLTPQGQDPNKIWTYADGNDTVTISSSKYFYYTLDALTQPDEDGNIVRVPAYYTTLIIGEENGIPTIAFDGKLNAENIDLFTESVNDNLYLFNARTYDEANKEYVNLCTQWYRDRVFSQWLGQQATGRYYFYDGVFTFALSDPGDVIKKVWETSESVPLFSITDTDEWDNGRLGAWKHIVTLEKATSLDDLNSLYMIAFNIQQTVNEVTTTQTYIVNLTDGEYADEEEQRHKGTITQTLLSDVFSGITPTEYGGVLTYDLGTSGNLDEIYAYIQKIRVKDKVQDEYHKDKSFYDIYNSAQPDVKLGVHVDSYSNLLTNGAKSFFLNASGNNEGVEENTSTLGNSVYTYDRTSQVTFDSDGKCKINFFYNYAQSTRSGSFWNYQYGYTMTTSPKTSNLAYNTEGYLDLKENIENASLGGEAFTLYKVSIVPQRIDEGIAGLVPPTDAATPSIVAPQGFRADQYVLYPQESGVIKGATYGDAIGAVTTSDDPTYTLVNIDHLGYNTETKQGTWMTGTDGKPLSSENLQYMFNLVKPAEEGEVTSGFLGGDLGGASFIKAPVGTDTETYIPLGAISFKINTTPTDEAPIKVRVIVAVPTTGVQRAEEDCYFALWRSDEISGNSQTISHSNDDAICKFELPVSRAQVDEDYNPYSYKGSVRICVDSSQDGIFDETDTDQTTYYTYLQGETVLVAYEFSIEEKGIYRIGSTNSPMQIVYFSVDGVASSGRDGTGGSQLKSIDFVYDTFEYENATSQKIVTVTNIAPDTVSDEDYNYYYPSHCLLFFDSEVQQNNQYVRIYSEKVKVRRLYDKNAMSVPKTKLKFSVVGVEKTKNNHYVKLQSYLPDISDKIETTYTTTAPS